MSSLRTLGCAQSPAHSHSTTKMYTPCMISHMSIHRMCLTSMLNANLGVIGCMHGKLLFMNSAAGSATRERTRSQGN